MDIEITNTLEILMIGDSITETDTTVYAERIVLSSELPIEQVRELAGQIANGDNTAAHVALTEMTKAI